MATDKTQSGKSESKGSVVFRHIMVTLLSIAIMGLFAVITVLAQPLDPVKKALQDFSFTDIYYEILSEGSTQDTSRVITIVDLTKLTRRSDIAKALEDIESCKPKVIGLDCCFDNEGEDFEGNDSLINVASTFKNIVFAKKMVDWVDDSVGWSKAIHSFFYEMTDIKEGTVNMPRQLYDRLKRRVPLYEKYHGKLTPSFSSQVVNTYAGKDVMNGQTEELNINFSPTVFRVLQPSEIKNHPEMIEDQIVLFGSMYEDSDMHWTPLGKIAGVELLAYGVQTLLLSNQIKYLPFVPFCIVTFLIILLMQVMQSYYLSKTGNSKYMFVKYVIGASYVLGILTFLFLSVFIGISFFVFKFTNISYNMAWAVAAIAFLGTSREMYASIQKYLKRIRL